MQKRTDYNGVTYFYSEALYPIRHGFSTRLGGLSRAEHTKSLNLGFTAETRILSYKKISSASARRLTSIRIH